MKACWLNTLERGFAIGAAEVGTTLLLEDQFNWSSQSVGSGFGFVAGVTVLIVTPFMFLQTTRKIDEMNWQVGLSAACALSALILFDLPGGSAWQLIFADCIILSTSYINTGITDSFAFRTARLEAEPESAVAGWQVAKVSLSMLARFAAGPIVRWLVANYRRNGYALVQLLVSLASLVSVFSIRSGRNVIKYSCKDASKGSTD